MRARQASRPAATCEVWWATPSAAAAQLVLLDDGERRRAERLRDRDDQDRFVTARALLRLVLSARTGTAPAALLLDTTCCRCGADHGKPQMIGSGSLAFSISHSGHRIAVAVTDGAAVGVDIELVGAPAADQLTTMSTSILAPAELADLERVAPSQQRRALAVWWTRKEALLKATGDGLTVPMSIVTVTAPDEPAGLRNPRDTQRTTAPMALLHDLNPDHATVGCVAALGVSSLNVAERDGDDLLAGAISATPTAGAPS